MEMFDKFVADEKAMAGMGSKDPLDGVVTVSIALILVATLGVAAWQLLGNANYTGVDPTVSTLVQTVIGIIAAIAIVILLIGVAKKYR
jgi:hypothetical protein